MEYEEIILKLPTSIEVRDMYDAFLNRSSDFEPNVARFRELVRVLYGLCNLDSVGREWFL